LEQSNVEKIFVAQDQGANLQEALSSTSKCVFFTKDNHGSSFGLGMLSTLEKVVDYYGDSELNNKSIMIVPCDIPLVTKDHFNTLIDKMVNKSADVTITIIAVKRLEKQYPQRRFRGVYLSDYKTIYTMQNILFINGEFIQFTPDVNPGKLKFSFRGWDKEVFRRVEDGITYIDNLRHRSYFHDKLFLFWLLTKGYTTYISRLLVDLAFRRLTMARVIEYLNGADHMRSDYVESESVEFSADIDRPEDFQIVLGTPWQSSK
jgi:hypothetical protein